MDDMILYRDAACVVVNKPSGMLLHRSLIDSRETVFLVQTVRNLLGQRVYPVHRLDRPTSGVVLFALDSVAAHLLARQFEARTVDKRYLAVVRGWTDVSGSIDYPLREVLDDAADALADRNKAAQDAQTAYRRLAQAELPFVSSRYPTSRYSLLSVQPHTGRKHQIRRHLKHIFHPIVGDTTYGDLAQNHAVAAFCGCRRLMLHAHSLRFNTPDGGQSVNVCAPPDAAWQNLCAAFGWQDVPLDF